MSNFEGHCREVVSEYLQTALIIDDQVEFGEAAPRIDSVDIVNPAKPNPFTGVEDEAINESLVSSREAEFDQALHHFDAKKATDAFYSEGIVAGLYKPVIADGDSETDFAESVCVVAGRSDVLIVDWYLKRQSSNYSKALIKAVLESDVRSGGRLRAVVVYTGEPNLTVLRDELQGYLALSEILSTVAPKKNGSFDIVGRNLVISFYNKPKVDAHAGRSSSEQGLPHLAIKEFSRLVGGLIPAFAMKSAAKIRENTGRIVAKFDKGLDSGFLAHRALLPKPSDSEVFMLENFVSYLRNILSIAKVDSYALGMGPIDQWLEQHCKDGAKYIIDNKQKGAKKKEYEIDRDALRNILNGGTLAGEGGIHSELCKVHTPKKASSILRGKGALDYLEVFDKSPGDALKSSKRLSVLASFRRTFEDVKENGEKPYLTQGTVALLKGPNESLDRYFLCVTPKCDTARVVGVMNFSFAVMTRCKPGENFDLVVPSPEAGNDFVYLSCDSKFHQLENFEFNGGDEKRVVASESKGVFYFTSGRDYFHWVGDLEDVDTQKRVANLVGNFNRVGVDEVEWLRRSSGE